MRVMKKKTVSVEYQINENGCPVIDCEERSYASVRWNSKDENNPKDVVTVEANRKGLVALAKWMLALADTDSYLDHQHFDNEVNFGFYRSDSDYELIIERVGK